MIGLNLSCKSADTVSSASTSADMADLETLLNERSYRIDINVVYPFNTTATTQVLNNFMLRNTGNTANRIDVQGESYFIELKEDLASGSLPFFGEQRIISGRYGGNEMGIDFKEAPRRYSVTKHKTKDAFIVEFQVDDKNQFSESYDVTLTVFKKKAVDVNISSSHRQVIRYGGKLIPIE